MEQWALISVSDKTGLEQLAQWLIGQGIGILASGGTAAALRAADIAVTELETLTGFDELLGGRVKTLHPRIYAGILSSESERDRSDRLSVEAPLISAVVVNLYPFERRLEEGAGLGALVESIDIGGVSLIRAAAKNFSRVVVVTDPAQYPEWMQKPVASQNEADRLHWAVRAFEHMAFYDAVIARGLSESSGETTWGEYFTLAGKKSGALRYGENPHQRAARYTLPHASGIAQAEMLQGKELSYNNLADADTAWRLASRLPGCGVVALKHQSPCGVALDTTVEQAYRRARDADPVSIFGGIVAANRPIDEAAAQEMGDIFLEVVAAPDFTPGALQVFSRKKNLRVLKVAPPSGEATEIRRIGGGFLVQEADRMIAAADTFRHVGGPRLPEGCLDDVWLAWLTVAEVKSNAIVVVKDGRTLGIGGGQTNRIDAARQALERAKDAVRGAVLASDAFFPFGDVMEEAAKHGIAVVVEPGGSLRDQESIAVAEREGITLLFTGERHFRH